MTDFLLPDLGEGLTEAEIVGWLVDVGDEVAIDQPVVEVETAKAVVEVPSPFAGTVTAKFGEPGQLLSVGSPLISVGSVEVSGNVLVGYGTPPTAALRRKRRAARGRRVLSGPAAGTMEASVNQCRQPKASVPPPAATVRPAAQAVPVISPLVRKIARDAGLDLAAIAGSGADGVVLRRDVEDAINRSPRTAAGTSTVADTPTLDRPDPLQSARIPVPATGAEDLRRIPITGVRRLISEKMSRSRREIPEATVWVDVDATDLLAARVLINTRMPEHPVSILGLFARFALLGLRSYPELNSRIDGDEIVLPSHVHLGIAAQTDRGLVVPVIRDAEKLSARDLSAAISLRAAAAKAGKLPPQDLSGGTFTVNNYGIFGVDGSAAIINHPEVAILGLGRIIDRPWVVAGQVVPRKMAQLTLTFDHRVCDGGVAGGFLRFVADCVEAPVGAVADL